MTAVKSNRNTLSPGSKVDVMHGPRQMFCSFQLALHQCFIDDHFRGDNREFTSLLCLHLLSDRVGVWSHCCGSPIWFESLSVWSDSPFHKDKTSFAETPVDHRVSKSILGGRSETRPVRLSWLRKRGSFSTRAILGFNGKEITESPRSSITRDRQ